MWWTWPPTARTGCPWRAIPRIDAPGLSADDQVHNVQIKDDLIPGRSEAEDLLDFTQGTMVAILAVSLALALGLGFLQGRALPARIDALFGTARSIRAGRLNRRIPLSGQDDELDELADQLNAIRHTAAPGSVRCRRSRAYNDPRPGTTPPSSCRDICRFSSR